MTIMSMILCRSSLLVKIGQGVGVEPTASALFKGRSIPYGSSDEGEPYWSNPTRCTFSFGMLHSPGPSSEVFTRLAKIVE